MILRKLIILTDLTTTRSMINFKDSKILADLKHLSKMTETRPAISIVLPT